MSTPTFYHSSDAGAPQLTSVNTAGQIIAILDACLVSGYGSKAAAGWTIEFTDTNIRVYRAGAGNRYFLRVDNTFTNGSFRMNAFGSMTSVSAGTEPFIPAANEAANICGISSTAPFFWTVAANNKFFYIYIRSSASAAAQIFYFGDLIPNTSTPATPLPYGTILGTGGTSTQTFTSNTGATTYGNLSATPTGKFLARNVSNSYVPTGTSATFFVSVFNHGTVGSSTQIGEASFLALPDTTSGLNFFERIGVTTSNGSTLSRSNPAHLIGFLPGAYVCHNALLNSAGVQPVSRLQVNSGPLNGTNMILFRIGSSINTTGNGLFIISENVPWG